MRSKGECRDKVGFTAETSYPHHKHQAAPVADKAGRGNDHGRD